jgi:hypothetical protein
MNKSKTFMGVNTHEKIKKVCDYIGVQLATGHSIDCKWITPLDVKVDTYEYNYLRPFRNVDGMSQFHLGG